MNAFDVLGDPVRRRILELLADGESTAGRLTDVVRAEFGITQPAVSRHLRVLRESGFADVRSEGRRRLYAVNAEPLQEVDMWLQRYRRFWEGRLDALETEIRRARRQDRVARTPPHPPPPSPESAITRAASPETHDTARLSRL
ncbi:MAG: winged helix-turn-helix transcriptional regulator [Acidimicrobiia bacterium]|nr:winged helix-turn-helix transcriptional regulator [Acidimicrobiia bacterium]